METLTELQARRYALSAAIDSGALRVEYMGKSIFYRSLDEMRTVLADLDRRVEAQLLTPVRRTRAVKLVYGGRDY